MEKSLEIQLTNFINTLILKKENPVFQDRDLLRRTCSAVVFKGLTSGSVYISKTHTDNEIDGIEKNNDALVIDLKRFPELQVQDGFLWIPDLDLIVLRVSEKQYQAFSSLCPICKNNSSPDECEDLRCALTQEWAFDINSCNKEDHHLHRLKVNWNNDEISIRLSSNEYLC